MEKRFRTFIVAVIVLFVANMFIARWFAPQQPAKKPVAKPAAEVKENEAPAVVEVEAKKPDQPVKPLAEPPQVEPQWFTLGSLDPASPYRMLVTFNNQGAAVERIELNGPHYHESTWNDIANHEDLSGYFGHLSAAADEQGRGIVVRTVGAGTPAAAAGLKVGDVISLIGDHPVRVPADIAIAMRGTRPGQHLRLTLAGRDEPIDVLLRPRPLQVVQPEGTDPLSYLLTLEQIDQRKIEQDKLELEGLKMRSAPWQVKFVPEANRIDFIWPLVDEELEVIKRYELATADKDEQQNPDFRSYHLQLTIIVQNLGKQPRELAYRLDGPTGLPTEGSWYTNKVSRKWFAPTGLRDVVVGYHYNRGITTNVITTNTIADGEAGLQQGNELAFAGVDAHYFASALIAQPGAPSADWLADVVPIKVGPVPTEPSRKLLTDITCRLIGSPTKVPPQAALVNTWHIFAGPKRPQLLAEYELGSVLYYGWFGWVSEPMQGVLHVFYNLVGNYGIAIVMLTVLVRSLMFPISRKQALNAQKMQELQPEMKRIAELYKKDMQERSRAQQELFRKHKYNPMSGCLPVFFQLPIFIGLYRSLSVDIELRQAPLISEAIRWCSNLSAPDMLWLWQPYLPSFITSPHGAMILFLPTLGPYLNVLPLVTIALFLWQQKMFMPPPTDEQSAMQQKMMKWMMVLMAFMFYKVPSGLCIYFIASSMWGLAERKLLPKPAKPAVSLVDKPATSGNGAGQRSRRRRSSNN